MNALHVLLITSGLAIGVVIWISTKDIPRVLRSLRRGRRVQGRIIRDEIVPFRYSAFHFPVVLFRDESGSLHEVKTRYHRETSAREQMEDVEIAYLPEDPKGTAVLVCLRYYLPTAANAAFFLALTSAIPALLFWAQR